MNILMHTNGSNSESSGIGKIMYGLGRRLTKKGHRVDYVFGEGPPAINYLFGLSGPMKFLKYQDHSIGLFEEWLDGKQYDIIHSHTSQAAYDSVNALKRIGNTTTKVVCTLHGMNKPILREYQRAVQCHEIFPNPITQFYLESHVKRDSVLPLCDSVTCVSNQVLKETEEIGKLQQVRVISNAVDFREFYPEKGVKKKKQLLFVGNNYWLKGLNRLIDRMNHHWKHNKRCDDRPCVWRIFDEYTLKVVGIADKGFIRRHQDSPIIFVPYMNTNELRRAYNESLILVVPSLSEGFGLCFLEANACGTPVLAHGDTGVDDLCYRQFKGNRLQSINGYWLPRNYMNLELDFILLMIMQGKLDYARRDCVRAARRFGWDKVVNQYEEVYREVMV